jgi:hypothetical protein
MIKELLVINCSVLVGLVLLLNFLSGVKIGGVNLPLLNPIVVISLILYLLWRLIKMATKNVVEIEDFSELGQSFNFKCDNKIYSVPPIPPYIAKRLIKNARELASKANAREELLKKLKDEEKEIPKEMMDEAESFYDFQIDFIITARIIEIDDVGEKLREVKKEDIEGSEEKGINGWSTQMVLKVFRRINDIISMEQEKKS